MAGEQSSYWCDECEKWVDVRGRAGHTGSKVHQANVVKGGGATGTAPVPPTPPVGDDVAEAAGITPAQLNEIVSENQDLRRRLLAAEKERDNFRPFVEVRNFESAGDVIAHYGLDHMRLIAEISLAADNKQRAREGRPPLWTNRDEYEQLIGGVVESKAAEIAKARFQWTRDVSNGTHTKLRTLKMVSPNGNLVQIPIDVTVNNGNGSLGDPVLRYQRKGFKIASPVRCKLVDCDEYATIDDGRYLFGGYCSASHERFMEGDVATTRDGQQVSVYSTAGLG